MRRPTVVWLTAACVALVSRCVAAQGQAVYLAPTVERQLAAAWDTVHAQQPERAYCLAAIHTDARGDSVWVVTSATRAMTFSDGPYHSKFGCAPRQPSLHTHPPTTCPVVAGIAIEAECRLGGDDAHECEPSDQDRASVNFLNVPFAVIQCDEHAYVIVYPQRTS